MSEDTKVDMHTASRNVYFLFFNIIAIAIYYASISNLVVLSFNNELYSHIVLIPFVSGYLFYTERMKIFAEKRYSFAPGIILIIIGSIVYMVGKAQEGNINQNDYLSLMTFSTVIFWIGGFLLFYGTAVFRSGIFPLLFLVLMIPIPTLVVDKIIFILQSASADVSYVFFKMTGVPVYREGFLFQLVGVSVEVAKECSGIRSSIALFITSILAGRFFLGSWWKKIIFALSIFPITIIKNGFRIITLSLLGAYVDIKFLTDSFLHKNGGILFFMLGLILLYPVLWILRKSEGEDIQKTFP